MKTKRYFVAGAVLAAGGLFGLAVGDLATFKAGDPIKSAEVNSNFSILKSAIEALEAPVGLSRLEIQGAAVNGKTLKFKDGALAWEDDQIGAGAGGGDISAVGVGTGLEGGGASGDVTLQLATAFRLPQSCSGGQVPKWNGSLWACGSDDVGTGGGGGGGASGDITRVTAGGGLSGGGDSGDVTLSLADNGVTSSKIASGAVTNSKLADGAVSSSKLADGAVIITKLAVNSVGPDQLINGGVIASKLSFPLTHSAAIPGTTGGNALIQLTNTRVQTGAYGLMARLGTYSGRPQSTAGIWGDSSEYHGVYGTSRNGIGVIGSSTNDAGVQGMSDSDTGVYGTTRLGNGLWGVSVSGSGVYGQSTSGASGWFQGGGSGTGYCRFRGGAGWDCTSDRNKKENFSPVDASAVLEAVAKLPITRWSMKGDTKKTPHIGPVAQDFFAAFKLGDDDKTINTADAQGVALAAIKGLNQKLETRNAALEAKVRALEARVKNYETLNARLAALEAQLGRN